MAQADLLRANGVQRLLGPVVPLLVGIAVIVGLGLRWWWPEALNPAGVLVLIVAVAAGLPHGALDVSLLSGRARPRIIDAAGYIVVAVAVYGLWWRWPAVGVGALLVVSIVHFASSDTAVNRWRESLDHHVVTKAGVWRAGATGTMAVAGPFAVWPHRTAEILVELHAGAAAGSITAAAWCLSLLASGVAVVTTWHAVRRGDYTGAVEFWLLAALVVTCPPLLAFGVYFAVWHSLRQTVRLLVIHPDAARRLTRDGVPAAARLLLRQAALPTVTAAAGLLVIGLHQHGASATVLVGLLAISVPHTVVTAVIEHRARATAPPTTPARAEHLSRRGHLPPLHEEGSRTP